MRPVRAGKHEQFLNSNPNHKNTNYMLSKKLMLTAMVGLMTLSAGAVPAKRDVQKIVQADGTVLTLCKIGDEHLHFTLTADGNIVAAAADGNYYYATVDAAGVAVPTTVSAALSADNESVRRVAVNINDVDTRTLYTRRLNARRAKASNSGKRSVTPRAATPSTANKYEGLGRTSSTFPSQGNVRGLIILVQYSDVKFTLSNPKSYFDDMINGANFTQYGGTGSATQYFLEQSGGLFSPQFDVLGPVTLNKNRNYYGGNDSFGNDLHPEFMVVDAVRALDATVDFSKYDMDNDGVLDNVYIIYAGQGEASYGSEDTVWPHSWDLDEADASFTVDGVKVNHYACSNEWEDGKPDGIGTFVHEFSHVMGLPDLYTTDYNTTADKLTPGAYSVLDYGPYNNDGRTPPAYSAYERNAMGWLDAIVLDRSQSVTLEDIITSNKACVIPTGSSTEFFLLENRQNLGWDAYIPGHGMLVWHIDYNESVFSLNTVNNTTHQYVDIVEAGGRANNTSAYTMAQYTFPGTKNVTSLTSSTSPALKTWAGAAVEMPITDITETDYLITFDADGGASKLPAPEAVQPDDVGGDYFTAVWNPVDGATDYLLTVIAVPEGINETETADMGSTSTSTAKFPAGWTSSGTDTYTSSGNFGQASPSYKMKSNGAYLQTRNFDGTITKVQFWAKGNALSGSTLTLQGNDGSGWVTLATFTDDDISSLAGKTFTVTDIPAGIHAVKFLYTKSAGNMALDDVVITTGAAETVLPGYDGVSTSGATSMRVNAAEGINTYRYYVVATDDTSRSSRSQTVTVDLASQGVGDITAADDDDAPAVYYNLSGQRVSADALAPGIYVRRQGHSVTKVIVR